MLIQFFSETEVCSDCSATSISENNYYLLTLSTSGQTEGRAHPSVHHPNIRAPPAPVLRTCHVRPLAGRGSRLCHLVPAPHSTRAPPAPHRAPGPAAPPHYRPQVPAVRDVVQIYSLQPGPNPSISHRVPLGSQCAAGCAHRLGENCGR